MSLRGAVGRVGHGGRVAFFAYRDPRPYRDQATKQSLISVAIAWPGLDTAEERRLLDLRSQ